MINETIPGNNQSGAGAMWLEWSVRSLKAQQIWLAGSSFIGRCPVSSVECTFLVENLGWKILVGNLEWKVFGGQYLVEFFAGKFWWTIWADFFWCKYHICLCLYRCLCLYFVFAMNTFVCKFLVWKRNNLTTFVFMYKYRYENTLDHIRVL